MAVDAKEEAHNSRTPKNNGSEVNERLVRIGIQAGLTILVFILYLYHCAPGIIASSEIAPSGTTNGFSLVLINQIEHKSISHPLISPLWFILARILRHVPFWDLPYLMNIMSSIFGAIGVLFLFKIVSGFNHDRHPEERLVQPHWFFSQVFPAIIISLVFAFSYPFWLLSEFTGPDTLQVMLFFMVLYFMLSAFRRKTFRYFYYAVAALAIGMSTYPVLAIISPILIIIAVLKTMQIKGRTSALVLAGIYAAGLLLFLYHPVNYLLRDHGQYAQYTGFFGILGAVISRQISAVRWMMNLTTIYWVFIVGAPLIVVFIRWPDMARDTRNFAGIIRITLNCVLIVLGVALMLGFDRRLTDPSENNLLMYSMLNPFPFVLMALWLGYLFGYAVHLCMGKNVERSRKLKTRRIVSGAILMTLLMLMPLFNLVMNIGPFKTYRENIKPYIDLQTGNKKATGGFLKNWKNNKGINSCSMRGYNQHEKIGVSLLASIEEMRYDPDSANLVANAVVTNSPTLASLLQYQRSSGKVLYKNVVNINTFRSAEWYYNRMMKYAFGIEPDMSWDIDRYDFADAIYETVMESDLTTICVFSIPQASKDRIKKMGKSKYDITMSMILAVESREASLSDYMQDGFGHEDIIWFSRGDVDSLIVLIRFFSQTNKQEKVDHLYLLMLEIDPDNPAVSSEVRKRILFYTDKGKINRAMDLVQKAAKMQPEYKAMEYAIVAEKYRSMVPPDLDKAIEAFRKSIEIFPNSDTFNRLAILYYYKKDYEEAYKCAQHACEMLTDSVHATNRAEILDTLGWIAFKLGKAGDEEKMKEAHELLKQAYDLNSQSIFIMLHYGALLYSSDEINNRTSGMALINRAKQAAPALRGEADQIVVDINALHKKRKENK